MFVILYCYSLLCAIHRLTAHSLVKVYLMTVKLGAINAGEEGLATYRHAACSTHSCTIYHQGVERYGSGE